jgi:hypothetical protein
MGVGPLFAQDLSLERRLELGEIPMALDAPQAGFNR